MPAPPGSRGGGEPVLRRVVGAAARYPGRVLVAVLVATALLAIPGSRLRIAADLDALLPTGSPAFDEYRDFLTTFGGAETIFVGVAAAAGGSASPEDLGRAAEQVADVLAGDPSVARVRASARPEDETFFLEHVLPHASLLLDTEDPEQWEALRARLHPAAVRREVRLLRERLLAPGGSALSGFASRDPLGITEEVVRRLSLEPGAGSPDPETGALLSADRDMALVLVVPARSEMDPEGGRAMLRSLEAAYAPARRASEAALEFVAVGGPLYAAYDEETLREDLNRTVLASAGLVAGVLVAAFGGVWVPLAALLAVGVGLVWTAGVLGAAVGEVTAVGIGFAAILVGLGVDYVVHFGGALRSGGDPESAVTAAYARTGSGIMASALTTAVGFACLSMASFRPLREMGFTVSVGIVAIALATGTAAAALLRLTAARSVGRRPPARFGRMLEAAVTGLGRGAAARPWLTVGLLVAATAAAVAGLARLSLDPDPTQLRPAGHPAWKAEERLTDEFSLVFQTVTVVVRGRDLPEALDRADAAGRVLRAAVGGDGAVWSPSDWLVAGERAAQRLARLQTLPLADTADLLAAELDAAGFRAPAFEPAIASLRSLAAGSVPDIPTGLPDFLADSVRQGPDGTAVAVRVRTGPALAEDGLPEDVLAAVREVAPGASVASARRVGGALRTVALGDLSRLGGLALGAVAATILLSFRGRVGMAALSVLPVAAGTVWTLGLWGGLGLPLDLFCLAVLPVMIGIGVDDGLHVLHRRNAQPGSRLLDALDGAARGMGVTTLTTAAGFASLAWSRVPALRNGGLLIATGVLACLLATALLLPALEALADRKGRA